MTSSLYDKNYVLPEYFGWFRPYAFLIFAGFLLSFALILLKAKRKNIPLIPLEKYLFIALPFGIVFASIFGKMDYKHPLPFYELFFVWQAGMSIHGAILGGLIAGLIFFPSQSRKYQISMWVWLDLIAPNILIGQIIGRWGNFFNHEILGQPVSYQSLWWLPGFIKDSCFAFDPKLGNLIPETFSGATSGPYAYNDIIFRQPLFLYEIFGNILLFIILTFIVPNIGKWFSAKPWHYKKYAHDFANLTWKGKWNKAYYELEVDSKLAKSYSASYQDMKINPKLLRKDRLKMQFKNKVKHLEFYLHKKSDKLTKLHNPYNLIIIRAGFQGSLFFFGYNFIRIFLETQRQNQELFIKNLPAVSYTFIIIFCLLGAISAIFAQFIAPKKWRIIEWYYEKQF